MSRPPMLSEILSEERFQALLEAYGARLSAWPAAERRAAEALIQASAAARASYDREAKLDAMWFGGQAVQALGADFERRLNELPIRHEKQSRTSPIQAWLKRWLWAPALGFSLLTAAAVVWGSRVDETAVASDDEAAELAESDALELALGLSPEFEEGDL